MTDEPKPTETEMHPARGKPGHHLEEMSPKEFRMAMELLDLKPKTFAATIGIDPSRLSRMRTGKAKVPAMLSWGIRNALDLREQIEAKNGES